MSRKDQSNAAAGLQKWITDSADQFKVLAQKRDADGPMQDRALDIVRAFIIERKLVLYGGLAIDYALRLKGSRIYPDDERPDFDVFSANSVQDAYDLADILYKAGFENVGAIRAIHVQTMRVKTDFIFVADISHTPADVFASLPFVTYRGIRVLHPDYQRMDMHLAFCFPFAGAPREDVFHRWKKDLKRFNIINQFYPVTTGAVLAATEEKIGGKSSLRAIIPDSVVDERSAAIHGFAAYGLLRDSLDTLMSAVDVKETVTAPKLAVELVRTVAGTEIRFDAPDGWRHLDLASPAPTELVADVVGMTANRVTWFDPFMDARPAMASVESKHADMVPIHVHSFRNKLLSVAAVDVDLDSRAGQKSVLIVSPQALLLYFLFEALRSKDAARQVATQFYVWTLEIINAATKIVSKVGTGKGNDDTIRKFLNTSPFFLSTRVLGTHNHDSAYLIKMAGASRDVGDRPPIALGIDPDIKALLDGLPANYHPKPGSRRPDARYDNPLFRRTGKQSVGTPVGV